MCLNICDKDKLSEKKFKLFFYLKHHSSLNGTSHHDKNVVWFSNGRF